MPNDLQQWVTLPKTALASLVSVEVMCAARMGMPGFINQTCKS